MTPINKLEAEAAEIASEKVGAYLEKLGRTDIAELTREEWLGMIQLAFTATAEAVRDLQDTDIPF